jgi:hypothetical protein
MRLTSYDGPGISFAARSDTSWPRHRSIPLRSLLFVGLTCVFTYMALALRGATLEC